jgi:DNA-binding Lrp family transcriptional regulator
MVATSPHFAIVRGKIFYMDAIDEQILLELQRDGRATVTELASRVGLSTSPCLRRLKALETAGAITGYHATVDAQKLGYGFEALVFATTEFRGTDTLHAFEEALTALPQIVEAQRLFGEPDYLLRVVAPDMPAYQRFYDEHLAALPGLRKFQSTIVMKRVVEHRPLPRAPRS